MELLHFDTFGHALLVTFVVASGGWEQTLARAMASGRGLDHQPEAFSTWYACLYFVLGITFFACVIARRRAL